MMQSLFKGNIHRFSFLLGGGTVLFVLALFSRFPSPPSVEAQVGTPAYSAINPGKELENNVKAFFDELISSVSTSKTFESWMSVNSSVSVSSSQSIDEMKSKLSEIKSLFGEFRSYDRVDVKPIGDDLVIVRYLLKCDSHPVLWTFTFYRSPSVAGSASAAIKPWHVIGLRFDTNLDVLVFTETK